MLLEEEGEAELGEEVGPHAKPRGPQERLRLVGIPGVAHRDVERVPFAPEGKEPLALDEIARHAAQGSRVRPLDLGSGGQRDSEMIREVAFEVSDREGARFDEVGAEPPAEEHDCLARLLELALGDDPALQEILAE